MVQQYQSPVRVYKYPFELIMAAYELRFPTCDMIPVFLGSDIISEYKSEDGAIEIVERRCRLNLDGPYILKKLANIEYAIFIQKNSLNRKSRTLDIDAYNETFSSRVIVREQCHYSVHPENTDWTCYEQEASMDVKSFFGFESTVEKLAMKQYSANIKKGKQIMEYFISELLQKGITYIPPWTAPSQPKSQLDQSTCSDYSEEQDILKENLRSKPTVNEEKRTDSPSSVKHRVMSPTHVQTLTDEASGTKLESEYIQRYLGQLTPYEESRLVMLRRWLQDTHKGKIPKDSHILRFLKARDYNIEKAREMLVHSLAWRKLHGIDRLLSTYKIPTVLRDFYSGSWHYNDKDGRPLYILKLGQMDVKGLYKSVGFEGFLRHILATINEEGLRRCEEATAYRDYPVTNCTCIVDLEGMSMRHLWRPGIKALLAMIAVIEANYPETMGYLLIVRAPRVFPVLWTLVSPFIDENTRKKFLIYGGNDYQGPGGLIDYVDYRYIPDFLGGDCYCDCPDGSLVPKNLYINYEDAELERQPDDKQSMRIDTLYNTAFVVKDYPHEVLIQVPQNGCVMTWDFDMLKGNATFTVLRSRRPLSTPAHEHHVSGTSGGSTQYIDRHLTIGIDVSIVEPPLVCRDGDSIQGSHVTSQSGSYILQFQYFDPARTSFDILSTHKSKVMYYTELLPSEQFRGSMSSLQSCQSGFSQLSLNTSQSSQSFHQLSLPSASSSHQSPNISPPSLRKSHASNQKATTSKTNTSQEKSTK